MEAMHSSSRITDHCSSRPLQKGLCARLAIVEPHKHSWLIYPLRVGYLRIPSNSHQRYRKLGVVEQGYQKMVAQGYNPITWEMRLSWLHSKFEVNLGST